MRRIGLVYALLLGLALCPPVLGQDEKLTAGVDRAEISANESLTLRVRYEGQTAGEQPDFSLLEENFDVISQRRSNQMRVVNGTMSAHTEWRLILAPKRTGRLLIPSFRYNGHFSDAIQVNVTEPRAAPDQLRELYIETAVDRSEAYVQQQVLVTYRLYTSRDIESLDAEPLTIDGVRVEELPQAHYQRRIDGVTYGVLEVRYALFPQASEAFTLPALTWTLRVSTGAGRGVYGFGASRYDLKRLRTEQKTIQVAAKPQNYPAGTTWLPANDLELTEEWSESPSDFQVGQPITRTLHLRARGLTAEQLPPLPLGEPPQGLRYYSEKARQNNDATTEGLTGTRTESVAIVPSEAGEFTLPPLKVQWWDVEEDQLRVAQLSAKTIYVQGGAQSAAAPAAPGNKTQTEAPPGTDATDRSEPLDDSPSGKGFFWQVATLVLACICVCLALLWWRSRRAPPLRKANARNTVSQDEKQAWRELCKAAENDDLRRLRVALLAWGASRWRNQPPHSLEELAQLIGAPAVAESFAALDAALYGRGSAPDTALLARNLRAWRRSAKAASSSTRSGAQPLRPLY